jgi:hypothetical protein
LSLILWKEHRLRIFQSIVLRRIFGPGIDIVTGGSRELPAEGLQNLYCSPGINKAIKSKGMRWV